MADKHQGTSGGDSWGPDPLGQPSFQTPPQQPKWSQNVSQDHWGPQHSPQRPPPNSYMTPAILVTLLCFLPTGIAAIVFASQVSAKSAAGDYPGAVEASRKARILILVSVGIGVVFWLIVIIAASASDTSNAYVPVP
ncbi:CD225/dispanin family protein [Streptomyces sp. NPDC051677]|uniref:CD225/dispanin family protein n=1 Tax=Streptomyces sp. NPDC051677 TaxID=3365669 RepID=UPI0037CF8857